MSGTTKVFFSFIAGAGIGAACSWYLLKTKYEEMVQEEVNSVKEVFSKRADDSKYNNKSFETSAKNKDKPELMEYVSKIKNEGYVDYSKNRKAVEKEVKNPYIISPDDFGEEEDYDTNSLTYYADEILADDNDDIVEDIENLIGSDSLTHFGEFEEDVVFVRNERLKCDYEILVDKRNYSDVVRPGNSEE